MDNDTHTMMELDIKLANVYSSLMDADLPEMDSRQVELLYMCLRMAFLEGERCVMEQINPIIADFQESMRKGLVSGRR